MNQLFRLDNKTILITGGSSGIGRSIAMLCAKLGATVLIVGRNEAKLADNVRLMGNKASYFVADLVDLFKIKELVSNLP